MNTQLLGMHNCHCFKHYLFYSDCLVLKCPGAVNDKCKVKDFGPETVVEAAILWILHACDDNISAISSDGLIQA